MKDKKIYRLMLIYVITNGIMLINNGIFWDDWTVIGMERLGLEQQFGENGMWIMTYVHDALNDGSYAQMVYHWLSFIFLFLAYAFFYNILKQFGFNANTAFLIAALAMVTPYFETKNTAICMAYSVFMGFFGAGAFLVFRFLGNKENMGHLALGLVLLLLSFFLNSLLLLFLFLLGLFFLYQHSFSLSRIKESWRSWLPYYAGLVILPFVFWFLKKTFFPITGLYAARGYNAINFSFEKLPKQYEKIFRDNILGLYEEFKDIFADNLVFGILVFVLCLGIALYIIPVIRTKVKPKRIALYAMLGMALFVIATYPYTLVNKLPSFIGYDTRHQILLPLGVAFLLFAIIQMAPPSLRKFSSSILMASFMTMTINSNLNFLRGWVKQEALEREISQLNIDTSGVIFITKGLNAKFNPTERVYAFYELNGLFKKALKRQDLLVISKKRHKSLSKNFCEILSHSVKFNMKDLTNKVNKNSSFQIEFLKQEIPHFETLALAMSYYFNREMFSEKINNILDVDYKNKE